MQYNTRGFFVFSSIQLAGSSSPQEDEKKDCSAAATLPTTPLVEVEGNLYSTVDPTKREDHIYSTLQQGEKKDCSAAATLPTTPAMEVEGNLYSTVDPTRREDHALQH